MAKATQKIDIGISEKDRKGIAQGLNRLLADSYTLYLMTHNFHWNVKGPMFNTLHLMFEGQYTELALAVDTIAERIRALGYPAPGTYSEFVENASDEPTADLLTQRMQLHEKTAWMLRSLLE